MYRIVFDAKKAVWVVQLQTMLVMWRNIRDAEFVDFDKAREYVDSIGLDNVYRDYRTSFTHSVIAGAQVDIQGYQPGKMTGRMRAPNMPPQRPEFIMQEQPA